MRPRTLVFLLCLLGPSAAHAGGLFFRAGAGPGFAVGSEEIGGARDGASGVAVSSELAIGTRVRPALVVGGGTFPMVVPGLGQHVSATGPFVEHTRGKLHVQGAALFVAGYHEAKQGFDAAVGFGFGAMAGVTYDVKRGQRWSVGPELRVTYYHWSGGDYAFDEVSPSVLVAFTYRSGS